MPYSFFFRSSRGVSFGINADTAIRVFVGLSLAMLLCPYILYGKHVVVRRICKISPRSFFVNSTLLLTCVCCVLQFTGGSECDLTGGQRSTTVFLKCGAVEEVTEAREDYTCHYRLAAVSPLLCRCK